MSSASTTSHVVTIWLDIKHFRAWQDHSPAVPYIFSTMIGCTFRLSCISNLQDRDVYRSYQLSQAHLEASGPFHLGLDLPLEYVHINWASNRLSSVSALAEMSIGHVIVSNALYRTNTHCIVPNTLQCTYNRTNMRIGCASSILLIFLFIFLIRIVSS